MNGLLHYKLSDYSKSQAAIGSKFAVSSCYMQIYAPSPSTLTNIINNKITSKMIYHALLQEQTLKNKQMYTQTESRKRKRVNPSLIEVREDEINLLNLGRPRSHSGLMKRAASVYIRSTRTATDNGQGSDWTTRPVSL